MTELALDIVLPTYEILQAHPSVQTVYSNFALCILEDFRGQGLATQLAEIALRVGLMAGCDATWVVTTSDATRKIFNQLGVVEWKAIKWEEVELEGGLRPFKNVKSEAIVGHFAELKNCKLN